MLHYWLAIFQDFLFPFLNSLLSEPQLLLSPFCSSFRHYTFMDARRQKALIYFLQLMAPEDMADDYLREEEIEFNLNEFKINASYSFLMR